MTSTLGLLMFPVVITLIFLGFPVAFSMMGTALVFGVMRFGDAAVAQFLTKVEDVASNYVLAAVPLFIFMGAVLERSGIAERLFEAIRLWTWRLPGGLAVASIAMCTIFAATSGVVGATETVVGLLAIPVMLRHRYSKALISGTICSGGSLGTIIPPSVIVVVLGPIANVSVGDLFAGIFLPGLLMAALYVAFVILWCLIAPQAAPRSREHEIDVDVMHKLAMTVAAVVPPVLLIVTVLGSILLGWATPTEAAGAGALGTVILSLLHRRLSFVVMREALYRTVSITAMILLILLGGSMFSGVFIASGGLVSIKSLLAALNLEGAPTVLLLLGVTFVFGFVLDLISITLIVIPVAIPLVISYGFDPIWFCVLFLVTLQTSYLTPPMAPSVFYLRAIAPPEITLRDMYLGVVPFIVLDLVTLLLVWLFPGLALHLPEMLFR